MIETTDSAPLLNRPAGTFRTIVSVHPLNRTRYINHFLEVANSRLTGTVWPPAGRAGMTSR